MDSQDSSEEESVFAEKKIISEWSDDEPFYGFESENVSFLIFKENFREIKIFFFKYTVAENLKKSTQKTHQIK